MSISSSEKSVDHIYSAEEIAERKKQVGHTLKCPYCDHSLKKWIVPQTIWTEWPNEYFQVCFNNDCSYYRRGFNTMSQQGYLASYRLSYDDLSDVCRPMPELRHNSLRCSIVDE